MIYVALINQLNSVEEDKWTVGCIRMRGQEKEWKEVCILRSKGLYIFGFANNGGDGGGSGGEDGSGVDSGQVDIGGDVKARHGDEMREEGGGSFWVLGEKRWKR